MPPVTRTRAAILALPPPSCTVPELQLNQPSQQKQMIVTVGDTVHDFGCNVAIQEKVIFTLQDEVHCFAASTYSEEQMNLWVRNPQSGNILRFHTQKDKGVEELVQDLLSDHYHMFPNISQEQYKEWAQVSQSSRSVPVSSTPARYSSKSQGIFLGNSKTNDGVFQAQESAKLEDYLKRYYGVENIVYVVDNGTKLKDKTFFCSTRPTRTTYFGLASQYDRGNSNKKVCHEKEFLTYELTHRDKELVELEYVRVSLQPDSPNYELSWKHRDETQRHVIDINRRMNKRNDGFVKLFFQTIQTLRENPQSLLNTRELENSALRTIQHVFGLAIQTDEPTEKDLQRYIRCLYDFKRAGDFLQVKSVRAANEKVARGSHPNEKKYIFFTNDRMAALEANLQGVPCILTISKSILVNGKALEKTKPLVYIHVYKPMAEPPPTQNRDLAKDVQDVYRILSAQKSKERYISFLNTLKTKRADVYEAFMQDVDKHWMNNTQPSPDVISHRRFVNRLHWTLDSQDHRLPSAPPRSGGTDSSPSREVTREPIDVPNLLSSQEESDELFLLFLGALHTNGYTLTFFYYVVFRFLYDMMILPYIGTDDDGEIIKNNPSYARSVQRAPSRPSRLEPTVPITISRPSVRPATAVSKSIVTRPQTRPVVPGTLASRAAPTATRLFGAGTGGHKKHSLKEG